ncbi:MAG: L,D-transpeptidase, partial [Magnetococcales bacterium]|nr:L,D-transpeptidase [Magnetococcales bacterium]
GDQPYDDKGQFAGGEGCGSGGGGGGSPGSTSKGPWWLKHLKFAANGYPTFNQWDAGQQGMTMKESMEAEKLREYLMQIWFKAAWLRDEISLLREHDLLPEGVDETELIMPHLAVVQALEAYLRGESYMVPDGPLQAIMANSQSAAVSDNTSGQSSRPVTNDPDTTLTPEQEKEREKKKLNDPQYAHRPVFPFSPSPGYLTFDGEALVYVENGKRIKSWRGASGRDGYQSKEHQALKDYGPIPEGVWSVNQERFQNKKDITNTDEVVSTMGAPFASIGVKFGSWSGGEVAWGRHRVWLEPDVGTDVHQRRNFSIHGGAVPGSAGCVDLTDQMPDFARWYKQHGKDIKLVVKYKK